MIVERYSQNAKLGGMGATYRQVDTTCPQSCPLLNRGCYAQRGSVALHQRRAEDRTDTLGELCGLDMVRHLVSGDLFRRNRVDKPFVDALRTWHIENPRTHGLAYTHGAESLSRAGYTPDSFPKNLTILASVDSPRARAKAKALGWRTARVIQSEDDVQSGEILCPYDRAKSRGQRPNPHNCRTCRLCWTADRYDIAFIAQGGAKR